MFHSGVQLFLSPVFPEPSQEILLRGWNWQSLCQYSSKSDKFPFLSHDMEIKYLYPDTDAFFSLMQELVKVHKSLMVDVQDSILNKNALNLYQIFISYKER